MIKDIPESHVTQDKLTEIIASVVTDQNGDHVSKYDLVAQHIDTDFIKLMLPATSDLSKQNIIAQYLHNSISNHIDPNPFFSAVHYLAINADVAAAGMDPLIHHLMYGRHENRGQWLSQWGDSDVPALPIEQISLVEDSFDEGYYKSQIPLLQNLTLKAVISHYLAIGWRIGLDPSPSFSTNKHLKIMQSAGVDDVNPLVHFLLEGKLTKAPEASGEAEEVPEAVEEEVSNAARDALIADMETVKPHFDFAFYRRNNPDLNGSDQDLLSHFMFQGWRDGRDPSSNFSVEFYRDYYSDIAENDINPFLHYVLFGRAEGRRAHGDERLVIELDSSATITPPHLASVMLYPTERELEVKAPTSTDPTRMVLHWIIPDFSRGGGGHMTIFRTIRHLEALGHSNKIWIENPIIHQTANEAWEDIIKYFQCVKAEVDFVRNGFYSASGDAVIATGWTTAYLADRALGFREKFYFVQDHEPEFYPTGAELLLAQATYKLDLSCICASPWLSRIMGERYGRWSRAFDLAYDGGTYNQKGSRKFSSNFSADSPCKIAVYSRDHTARRCVALALMALEQLGKSRDDFEVHFYGQEALAFTQANFRAVNHGVLDSDRLASLYNSCDIGICFSATNYSLVPQEMMACGLPLIELNSASTLEIFPHDIVTLAGPDPLDISHQIADLMDDTARRSSQAVKASQWVNKFSWERSARVVQDAIEERIFERSKSAVHRLNVSLLKDVRLDVVIPTFNGLHELRPVIEALRRQADYDLLQIHCIDSSSTDGTIEYLAEQHDVSLTIISQKDFGHGRTRNDGAALGRSEVVAFLTQDAIPANPYWATDILKMFDHVPSAAGLTGKHLPYPHHPLHVREEINSHFNEMLKKPLILSRETDPDRWASGDIGWRQFLHFYSDNNSAMRRQVWAEIPYQDVEYGEDQLWAREIIEAGFEKLYAPTAIVFHSHDYSPAETYKRSKTEGYFFYKHFGYDLDIGSEDDLERKIQREQHGFRNWSKRNKVSAEEAKIGLLNIEQKHRGLREGVLAARHESFVS